MWSLMLETVWIILTKDRLREGEYNNVFVRKIGLVEITKEINPNVYL